jgi:uncharacterized membrane protein
MDSPMLARVAIVVGALLVLISLFADPLGLGRSPGFGWKQILGVVVGALVILAGVYLWWRQSLRGKVSP